MKFIQYEVFHIIGCIIFAKRFGAHFFNSKIIYCTLYRISVVII